MLYTLAGRVKAKCYYVRCKGGCTAVWSVQKEKIFRIFKVTCIRYEVGFDFVNTMMVKCNFSAYCDNMDARYKMLDTNAMFLGRKTFTKWWFSWVSHQKHYFRQVCSGCGSHPKVLSCDATKIGIADRNKKISHEIQKLMSFFLLVIREWIGASCQ